MSRHLKPDLAACWRRFEAKLGSKIDPSWPQERLESGAKSIFEGLEVERLFKTIRHPTQDWPSAISRPKLGLWEEGREEGKPSTHTV